MRRTILFLVAALLGAISASAVAQTLQANRERPRENALKTGAPSKVSTYQTMNDKEFDDYLEKVRRGEAKI